MGLTWGFLVLTVVIVITPGADFAVVLRNSIVGGRRQGVATVLGVTTASAIQGLLVSLGVAGVLVRIEPLFAVLKWLGVAYLAFLAFGYLRQAVRGQMHAEPVATKGSVLAGFRRGFLSNITNPKIIVFYLSLLPQFVGRDASWSVWLAHALTIPALGTVWCLAVVALVQAARRWLRRPRVRRIIDACTGVALLGFCARLATSSEPG